jgi:putative acyl-CoA dehydrogenase
MALGPFETHAVTNQPPAPAGANLYDTDPVLVGALEGVLDEETEQDLIRLGAFWGSPEAQELGRLADRHPPELRTHDPRGRRLDFVEYHPAYHAMLRRAVEHGLASSLWQTGIVDVGARHTARAARLHLVAQGESGHLAALSTTSAALAVLQASPDLAAEWRPALTSRRYDHRFLPVPSKLGALLGLGLTETQAGSDLAAVTTRAERAEAGTWRLVGHKWFLSAPMSDGFLALARAGEGPTAFLVPRFLGDGSVNRIRFVRQKAKVGSRAEASVEAEFAGAEARLVGAPGQGISLVSDVVRHLRFDRAVVSAGLMRAALGAAAHHARHRAAFGAVLVDQPLMQRVLADMALDVAAATALVMRLARAFDNAATDPAEEAYARLMTPVAKYWVTKIAPALVAEALECAGGTGYVEESVLARLYREAPANAVWDGPGSVLCLEMLSEIEAGDDTLGLVLGEIERDLGRTQVVSFADLSSAAEACLSDVGSARVLIEQIALAAAAAALRRAAPRLLSDAFLDSRVAGPWRATYGMLDARFDPRGIVDFVIP